MTQTNEYSKLIEYSKESLEKYIKTLPQHDPKIKVIKALIKSIED